MKVGESDCSVSLIEHCRLNEQLKNPLKSISQLIIFLYSLCFSFLVRQQWNNCAEQKINSKNKNKKKMICVHYLEDLIFYFRFLVCITIYSRIEYSFFVRLFAISFFLCMCVFCRGCLLVYMLPFLFLSHLLVFSVFLRICRCTYVHNQLNIEKCQSGTSDSTKHSNTHTNN